MIRSMLRGYVSIGALVVLAPAIFPGAARSSEPPPREVRLYEMDASGRNPALVTRDPRGISNLQWSPDSRQLLLGRSDGDLWQWNRAAAREQQLTRDPEFDGRAVYSPDGRAIAFDSQRGGNVDIYVLRPEDGTVRRLTDDPAYDTVPRWSPDGEKIAFHSRRAGVSTVFVMNADGTGQQALTVGPAADFPITWSPDGRQLVFCRGGAGHSDLYRVNVDGSGETRLTHGVDAHLPTWHRNGRILFTATRFPERPAANPAARAITICTIRPNGADLRALTAPDVGYHSPAWSPDGRWIAYSRAGEVWRMRADGSRQTQLTHGPQPFARTPDRRASVFPIGFRRSPSWSPDGKRLAFLAENWEHEFK
jgi:Tol biopolymer transport system component